MSIQFGYIGVCIEDYTVESLYELLVAHEVEDLIDEQSLLETKPFTKSMYLQSEYPGPFREGNTINVHEGFIHYLIDMDNFLHIICVGLIDPDMANSLVDELYSQGLIKPRNRL